MKNFRDLRKFMNDPVVFLNEQQLTTNHPHMIKPILLGPKRFILVFDPLVAHHVLSERPDLFIQNRTIFDRIKPITGNKGLVQLNGAESKTFREKFAPMFSPTNMIKMKGEILENTLLTLKEIKPNSKIDITTLMADLVLRNAFKIFLGLDIKKEASDIALEFQELNALCGQRMISGLSVPLFIPTTKNNRIKFLQRSLREKITLALKTAKPQGITIPMLFKDDETLVDQCMTFLFAGHETTASSLSFTFLLLGQNPHYIKEIAAGNDALALMTYKEALRLFPPAYMLAREAAVKTELHDLIIKKGDQIIIGVKQIQNSSSFHQNPAYFYPERFKESHKAFFPFGLGPKDCIGEGLAYMEALTIIKTFCKTFNFSAENTPITSYPLVTLHPKKGQYITIKDIHHDS